MMQEDDKQQRVVIIGGGASGLMAAGTAGGRGHHVTLLERNEEIGRKLEISGKGRCNLTNNTTVPGLEKRIAGHAKFLRSAFYRFGAAETIAFFTQRGVPVKTERGGRVFPVSDLANDVVQSLLAYCTQNHVAIVPEVIAKRLCVAGGRVTGVEADDGVIYPADAIILATGGASYPGTGSRGDGYRMAQEVGHTIIPIRPSLVPLETLESWPVEVQGVSLRNVTLTAYLPDGTPVYSELGEMLFTHYGVSGPIVLSASRHVADHPGSRLEIDLKPGLDEAMLDARVVRDFAKFSRREFANALGDLLPRTLIPVVGRLTGIPSTTPVHQITREQRRVLVQLLKHLTVTVKKSRGFAEAIITVGGVNTLEIDSRTMQSKLIHGLYCTGEVLDVDAYTGGYNLQIAWATGFLAGMNV